MIEPERLVLEEQDRKDHKDSQRNHFLDHLQLDECERTPGSFEADPVRGHLQCILEQRNAPADQNDRDQRKALAPLHLLKLQMPIPRQGHKGIGKGEEDDG